MPDLPDSVTGPDGEPIELPRMAPKKRTPRTKAVQPSSPYGVPMPTRESAREFMVPGCSLIECIVGACEWVLVMPPVFAPTGDQSLRLAAAVGVEEATGVIVRERAEWIDTTLRSHLETHDVVEWAETVRDVEAANRAWEESTQEVHDELVRTRDMNEVLSRRLTEAEATLTEFKAARPVREARSAARTPPPDAMPLPHGIPFPEQDPMKERIVSPERREEGQVARRG